MFVIEIITVSFNGVPIITFQISEQKEKTHSFAITKVIFQYIHPSIESDCPPSVRPIVCLFVTKNTSEYKWMDFRVKGV